MGGGIQSIRKWVAGQYRRWNAFARRQAPYLILLAFLLAFFTIFFFNRIGVSFSATRLRELAKMDGAIVLDEPAANIVRAAVQLVPDPAIPTDEAGTRHRTAERVARQTGYPVISVSKSMRIIALYIEGTRRVLEDSAA